MNIDLNADVGEGADDEPMLRVVTSANIACGGHAGDADFARRTIRAAIERGVAIGAHPGYPDRENFGRTTLELPRAMLVDVIAEQIAWLRDLARSEGTDITHVKPHGALYNDAARDDEVAAAIGDAVRRVDAKLAVFGLAGSPALARWQAAGLRAVPEAFCDRAYERDGTLRDRRLERAVLLDPSAAARQAVSIARDGHALAHGGGGVKIAARTLCVHGDTPHAADIAEAVRTALVAAGISLAAPDR